MAALSAYRSSSSTETRPLWLSVMLALAVALAGLAVVAATAQAGSFDHKPPKTALLTKGGTVLQPGRTGSSCWTYYLEDGGWVTGCADTVYSFPRADLVGAGSRLHIRLDKPQRPESFGIIAYKGFDREQMWPIGEGRHLDTTLRRVEQDGKTAAWDVFFCVKQPDRHYYLDAYGTWERVPGTHISYGQGEWFFHVKTR